MTTDRPPLHAAQMLRALDAHGVRYVVIGGVAGRAHGDQAVTYDLDITPDPETANLDRLAAALTEMGAGLRVPDIDEPLPVTFDGRYIRRFTTMSTRGRQLAANAVREEAFGVAIAIAGLEDLVASRRASADITGLDHYAAGAQRLAELPGRSSHSPGGRRPQPGPDPDRPPAPPPPGPAQGRGRDDDPGR